jgi:hypothetical protein
VDPLVLFSSWAKTGPASHAIAAKTVIEIKINLFVFMLAFSLLNGHAEIIAKLVFNISDFKPAESL